MGIYLNPDNVNFKGTLKADIYVDKTMMIDVINRFIEKENKYICVSRPRRFGKTIAGNMLAAYYSRGCDSRELFRDLKIAEAKSFTEHLNRYNVIQIDLNSEYQNTEDKSKMICHLTRNIRKELRKEYPDVELENDDGLARAILKVYDATGDRFIIILDEYDVLVREQADPKLFAEYLSLLNGLFKSNTLKPAIALAYLTGILPIVRDKIQSKLNNFREYTFLDAGELAEYIGFTENEVQELCKRYDMDFEECKRWYDGYAQQGVEIYNPEAVVQSMEKKKYGGYWGKTSSYEVISDQIRGNAFQTYDDVIRMLANENIPVDVEAYLNTMSGFSSKDDVFTYLIHLGYLAFDEDNNTCRIPNSEVRKEWIRAITRMSDYSKTDQIIRDSEELLKETLAGNGEAVAAALDISHIHVTSNRSYNNEDALQSAIYLAYIYALNKYTLIKEMTTGKGFADVLFIPYVPDIPALVIELKRNGNADSAINQIREKKYFASLEHYSGNLLFVGIDYDEKKKTHTCRIERFSKE
ncbi:MAG: AAA family ATPase [Lachnospiraceae bacterium]|nr:AAA family ATPase [Lachnospiraceae bacterium]